MGCIPKLPCQATSQAQAGMLWQYGYMDRKCVGAFGMHKCSMQPGMRPCMHTCAQGLHSTLQPASKTVCAVTQLGMLATGKPIFIMCAAHHYSCLQLCHSY